jgi:hypothetical protein
MMVLTAAKFYAAVLSWNALVVDHVKTVCVSVRKGTSEPYVTVSAMIFLMLI